MISVEVRAEDERHLAKVWMREAPRVGELLWFAGETRERLSKDGIYSVVVVEIAHWVTDEWVPGHHVGDPIHSVCAVVRPVVE